LFSLSQLLNLMFIQIFTQKINSERTFLIYHFEGSIDGTELLSVLEFLWACCCLPVSVLWGH
jgi:hypothetical protein